jgi:hypothetical protein
MGSFQRAMLHQIHYGTDHSSESSTGSTSATESYASGKDGGTGAVPATGSIPTSKESLDEYMQWWSVRKQIRHQMKLMMQQQNPDSYLRDVDLAPEMIGTGPAD